MRVGNDVVIAADAVPARVVSVNVGAPRDVPWQGKTVRTAIWKAPVRGRVWAGRLSLAGDSQADLNGHGGEQRAIMVYQTESYSFWANELRRDDLGWGHFGENLTIDGLADSSVCIGDRFRIGGAVVEVTQPRVTCYKVGIRLNCTAMPALLVKHKRPGFYLRVLKEGEIGAGDLIEIIADGPEQISVAEMDGLLYSGNHPREDVLRATRIPALSVGWQESMQALLDAVDRGDTNGNAGLGQAEPPLAWPGLRDLTVAAVVKETSDVFSFELASANGVPLPDGLPGQHIAIRVALSDGKNATRNYSLSGPSGTGRYRIGVKREDHGLVSSWLHERLVVGATIESSAPRGTFLLDAVSTPIVLISAGIGVTPMLAMLHAAAGLVTPRDVWWIHAAKDGAHHAFREEAQRLIEGVSGAHRCIIYSKPSAGDRPGIDYDVTGHVDFERLQALSPPLDAHCYLCGPPAFLTAVTADLERYGVAKKSIHAELFGAIATPVSATPPHPPVGPVGDGPLVTFARSNLAVPWDRRFNSLLELAEACDVPLHWSCRTGVCHACETGLIDGTITYSPEPIDAPPFGTILVCCSTPSAAVQLDL
jgi:ferredoxin-NADP reductase/MOSC domain-containing protein YiiM